MKYIEYDTAFAEEEKKQAKALKVACNLNDAASKLKLKEYKQAEKLCTKVSNCYLRNLLRSFLFVGFFFFFSITNGDTFDRFWSLRVGM